MARKKAIDSTNSFGGLDLDPEYEMRLLKWLSDNNKMSLNFLKRKLIREHLEKVFADDKAKTRILRS